jgi:2-polyprenyl-3-methyl-5-hydroxy-6-metoxy-1,4-benzoquinol methylase
MENPVRTLYENHAYPAMSHPISDPALSAVAASIGGLRTPPPAGARILEIGCCSGHNLIPLALRWPQSECVGMDFDEKSIREARTRAAGAGAANVQFEAADLRDYQPGGGKFDYIIAHGFFSWVPDEVKAALLIFCRENLSPSGIATISFNLECGWAARFPVIQKARMIQEVGGVAVISALEVLREMTAADSPEIAIIDDMLAKGPAILAFDDFGPVNDAWSLDRFAQAAANAGLKWLGETDPAENIPSSLSDEVVEALAERGLGPLELQMAADSLAGRTFRSGVLCRADAPTEERIFLNRVLDFSLRAGKKPGGPMKIALWQAIQRHGLCAVSAGLVGSSLPEMEVRELAGMIYDGISNGWILARIEPVIYDSTPPDFPRLNPFRGLCAEQKLPLVDIWHKPCLFPEAHYQVLTKMDGSRSREEIADFARAHCPELAFDPWLRHLTERGMFA